MDPFLGEIRLFAFDLVPKGWRLCDGKLVSINQMPLLYSLLGTTYGGDGVTQFALPNLGGRIAVQCEGETVYKAGTVGGSSNVTLTIQQMARHPHTLPASASISGRQPAPSPDNVLGALQRGAAAVYSTPEEQAANSTNFMAGATDIAGGGLAHNNMAPFLALHFCIAIIGLYPA